MSENLVCEYSKKCKYFDKNSLLCNPEKRSLLNYRYACSHYHYHKVNEDV